MIVAFAMPNGDLSQIATEMVLRHKEVDLFVMAGAGGSLISAIEAGHYQHTTKAELAHSAPVELPSDQVAMLDKFSQRDFCHLNQTNVTVMSPLVETKKWLADAKRNTTGSVDVETYFILSGINAARKTHGVATQVFPGLFVSDVVGEHPLVGKIDLNEAWQHLPALTEASFDAIGLVDT